MDLVLYSRKGCHLCDEMLAAIHLLDQHSFFNVKIVDIDKFTEFRDVYSARIPVLTRADNQHILCESYLDEEVILSLLPPA